MLHHTDQLVWWRMSSSPSLMPQGNARQRLLEASVKLVRAQGFAGTSVEQLCKEAGVTKGAFFHHFPSKEALGVAAAEYWSLTTSQMFAVAPYHNHPDPVDRVLGCIDFRIELVGGPVDQFSCVAGTLVQEAFLASPAIRDAARDSIMANARALEADIAEALESRGITDVSAASLARHFQTVVQGSIIIAKTQEEKAAAELAREGLGHLRRYFELLFAGHTKESVQ
jgi:TetR/AcrR family transcriptional regulator, transcriptional repressor for nem operon